jgi:dTDP-4-dehydrorhamnose 3,5-epimerase
VRFTPTPIDGAFLVELDLLEDERGHFARTFCAREFAERGLDPAVAQTSVSMNRRRGTLRGMHWQAEPAAEAKLVRCTRGAIWDVIVDLRPGSPTRLEHYGVELSEDGGSMLYVPALVAHGFQTLADDSEVSYQISEFFAPEYARGARHDDPAFGISWPLEVSVISDKDRSWPAFEETDAGGTRGLVPR